MEARRLLSGTSFGPDAMAAIGKAFDQVWTEVAHHFPSQLSAEAARLTLANVILTNATEDSRDADDLAVAARKALAIKYPTAFDPSPLKP